MIQSFPELSAKDEAHREEERLCQVDYPLCQVRQHVGKVTVYSKQTIVGYNADGSGVHSAGESEEEESKGVDQNEARGFHNGF